MQKLLKEENPDLYLCPDLSQWGYFLNIYGRSQVDHEEEEKLLKAWVEDGGVYLHGPKDAIAKKVFGGVETSCEKRPFRKPGEDIIIPQGICFSEYEEEETISAYIDDGKTCIGSKTCGKGKVYSFGVMAGASYCAKNIPHVPYNQGNKEMYPWTMSGTKVMEEILLVMVAAAQPEKCWKLLTE